ncbi:MAG: hypothetical protein Q4G68_01750 [Planctomycetia bacterium]|nr:hypothetical protein [Planctomycetia bacterium]
MMKEFENTANSKDTQNNNNTANEVNRGPEEPQNFSDVEEVYSLADSEEGTGTSVAAGSLPESEEGSPTQAERIAVAEESVRSADVYGIEEIAAPFFAKSSRRSSQEPAESESVQDGSESEVLSLEEIYARKRKQTLQKQLAGEDEFGFELKRSELPRHPFMTRIFSPFVSPGFILRLLLMTGMALVPFFLCTLLFTRMLDQHFIENDWSLCAYLRCLWEDRVILTCFCFLWGVISIPFSLNVFSATSDGDDKIIDWPEYSFVGGMGQFLWMVLIIMCAGIPGACLGQLLGSAQIGFLGGVVFLTPVFFLSTMDADSPFVLVTGDVLASFTRVGRAWFNFYVISIVLFNLTLLIGVAALCAVHKSGNTLGGVFTTSLIISLLLSIMPVLYLRFLGRLGWLIEETNRKRQAASTAESVDPE